MTDDITYTVRTRAVGRDLFAGLKGHDYIRARELTPRPNHHLPDCAHCALMEKLPTVRRLLRKTAVRIGREKQQQMPARQQIWRIA